jgi:transposase
MHHPVTKKIKNLVPRKSFLFSSTQPLVKMYYIPTAPTIQCEGARILSTWNHHLPRNAPSSHRGCRLFRGQRSECSPERVEILLDIPEEQKVCPETGEPLKVIAIEVSEKLEYRPGKLIVNVYKRPQYALPESADSFAGVIAAAMPDHPIAKCKADVGLLAHLIVSKFADHLPLYRQDGIFKREGVTIPRATQSYPSFSTKPPQSFLRHPERTLLTRPQERQGFSRKVPLPPWPGSRPVYPPLLLSARRTSHGSSVHLASGAHSGSSFAPGGSGEVADD